MSSPSRRRSFTLPTIAVLVIGGVALAFFGMRPQPPIEVEVVRVAKGEVQELIPAAASGEVRALRRVTVRAELAGTVVDVRKQAGDRVELGELVVQFSSDEFDARVAQAQANVEASRVLVEVAKDRDAVTKRALERSEKLSARGAISTAELERVQAEARASKLGVDKATSAVVQAKSAERLARVARARATVVAPFAGVLQEVAVQLGVQVAPGTALFDLIDDAGVTVDVPIDEADVPKVVIGQEVLIRSSGRRGDVARGKVTFIPPAMGRPSKGQGTALEAASSLAARDRALYVSVTPDDPKQLRIGASVDAELLVRAAKDVLWIPTHVVMGRGMTRSVYKVVDGRVKKVTFEPGLTSWERTQIVGGLAENDVIVSSLDVKGLDERVRVVTQESNAP